MGKHEEEFSGLWFLCDDLVIQLCPTQQITDLQFCGPPSLDKEFKGLLFPNQPPEGPHSSSRDSNSSQSVRTRPEEKVW